MQLILTIFHHLIGPKIYLAYPDETDKDLEMLLGQLLDLNGSEDQFSEYRDTQLGNKVIYNYKFSIPSEWSRGRKEMAMYAIISEKPLKLNFYQKHIDELVREFKQSPHFYKAFYKDERRGQGVDEQYGLLTEKTEDLYCFLKTKIKQHHIVRKIKENLEEYALNIVDLQYEKHPSLLKTFTKRQKAYTIDDTKHNLDYLVQSIQFGFSQYFCRYLKWLNVVLVSRGLSAELLSENIKCIGEFLESKFERKEYSVIRRYLDDALESLNQGVDTPESYLEILDAPVSIEEISNDLKERDLANMEDREKKVFLTKLAKIYFQLIRRRQRHDAIHLILNAVDSGLPIIDVYQKVFQPVQYEIGRLWELNEISVAEEHYYTAITQLCISQLYPKIFSAKRIGKTMVAACIGGELHEMGIRMLADIFELYGWDTHYLGANVPVESIISTVKETKAKLIAISATMLKHVDNVKELIEKIRDSSIRDVKILVGGYPFSINPDLWQLIGADDYAVSASEAVEKALELTS